MMKIFQSTNNSTEFFQYKKGHNKKHVSLVVGPSQHGKDTFILNLDPEIEKFATNDYCSVLEFGDGRNSCTKACKAISYFNNILIPGKEGVIFNTIGFGDTNGENKDEDISCQILKWCMDEAYQVSGKIDIVYFVQALDKPFLVEKCIKQMIIALGEDIVKSSVILASFGNKIDKEDYEDAMNDLIKIAQRHGVLGGVVDFRGNYVKKNKKIQQPYGFIIKQVEEIRYKTCSLPSFDLQSQIIELQQFDLLAKQKKEASKYTKCVGTILKTREIRLWYTLWLMKGTERYTDAVYENYYSMTTAEAREEAINELIEKRIASFNKAVNKK